MSGDFYGVFNDALGTRPAVPAFCGSRYDCFKTVAIAVNTMRAAGCSKDDIVAALEAAARCERKYANITTRGNFALIDAVSDGEK